jgi:hypothetical protein
MGRKMMAESASEFLERWKHSYIARESCTLEQVDTTVKECLDDAAEARISASDLEAAAGGDLRGYLLAALKQARGE